MRSQTAWAKHTILRYPQLDTILMVEEFIKEHSGEYTKKQAWERLPKKMMYQTFCTILDYLEYSGKIAFDQHKRVAWIYNPELVKKYLSQPGLDAGQHAEKINSKIRGPQNKRSVQKIERIKGKKQKTL